METVAIFGVGLIGGSFALALRKAGFAGTILGVSSEATLARAIKLQVIDAAASVQTAAQEADLLYLAQPVHAILSTLVELNQWVRPGALITDAGSTKQAIVQRAAESLTKTAFLGGHPLAGKENRGLAAAEADLFRGRPYVLTPTSADELKTPAAESFRDWLERIGAIPVILDAGEHDRTVAFTSHLPQMASTALGMLLSRKDYLENGVFGPALLDSTRLALSPYEIWADILETNAAWIHMALSEYIEALDALRRDLTAPEMAGHFESAAAVAERLRTQANQ